MNEKNRREIAKFLRDLADMVESAETTDVRAEITLRCDTVTVLEESGFKAQTLYTGWRHDDIWLSTYQKNRDQRGGTP